jgi:molybdopterin/thiamine biosynthesis adenylyltransferase
VLDSSDAEDAAVLRNLRSEPGIEFVDGLPAQKSRLERLTPPPQADLLDEPPRWVFYPWRRTVVGVLGPRAFRHVRLDRNRHLITAEEQDRLDTLCVGVVGLSVGHTVAHALAAEGVCGKLRLADFDTLDLTNLNRVPATVLDLGVNKAVVAARRIAELDPYLAVEVMQEAVSPDTVDDFLDGLDVVVEECDSLDVKVLVRESARARGLPVLMATSDRGLMDVERFDLQPGRPVLHGLLGAIDAKTLSGLTSEQKVPYVLRVIEAKQLTARGAASLIEIGHSISTWPQLAGDVAVGGAATAEAVRRIGLGEPLRSGRVSIDVAVALDSLAEPAVDSDGFEPGARDTPEARRGGAAGAVAAAAQRAPSGGNAQPWRITAAADSVTISLDTARSSGMDVAFRGSAVAVGAAAFNARVAAAAHGVLGAVELTATEGHSPLEAVIQLDGGKDGGKDDRRLADLYQPMLARETNRHRGTASAIDSETIDALQSAARSEGGELRLLTGADDIGAAAALLAEAEQIRYLTPHLHADMVAEMSWSHEVASDTGIDVRSLELSDGELALLELLRRPEVMAELAAIGGGAALGADTSGRLRASSALGVVGVRGERLVDYFRGGSAAEAVWVTAAQRGVALQPISPVFLYAQRHRELAELSPSHATVLERLHTEFRNLFHAPRDETLVLVIRLFNAPATSVRSRRRGDTVHSST